MGFEESRNRLRSDGNIVSHFAKSTGEEQPGAAADVTSHPVLIGVDAAMDDVQAVPSARPAYTS